MRFVIDERSAEHGAHLIDAVREQKRSMMGIAASVGTKAPLTKQMRDMDAVSLAGSLAPQDHERQPSGKSEECASRKCRSISHADRPLFGQPCKRTFGKV